MRQLWTIRYHDKRPHSRFKIIYIGAEPATRWHYYQLQQGLKRGCLRLIAPDGRTILSHLAYRRQP